MIRKSNKGYGSEEHIEALKNWDHTDPQKNFYKEIHIKMQTVRKIGIQAWNQQCKGMKEWQGRKEDKDEITVKPEVIMREWQEYI